MVEVVGGDPWQVGPYRVVGRLGSGGMGRVYLARSPGGRAVAVKTIRPELAEDPEFRRRFAREAEAARAVSGAFTAAVVDADPYGDPPWLATVHVAGMSLADAVERHGPLPPATVLALGAGLAEALQAIHAASLVHRDLKPSNVLLAPDGPKVIDFGIALTAGSSSLTRAGVVVGTPAFMAPEQLTAAGAGAPADVFALGGVLAFAATGRPPFGVGTAAGVGYRVVHHEPDLHEVPVILRVLLARCLAKDPAHRPQVGALLGEFASAQRQDTVSLAFVDGAWLPPAVAASVRSAGQVGGTAPERSGGTSRPDPWRAVTVDPYGNAPGLRTLAPHPDTVLSLPDPVTPTADPASLTPTGPDRAVAGSPNRRRVLVALAGVGTAAVVGGGVLWLRNRDDDDGGGGDRAATGGATTKSPAGSRRWTYTTGGPVTPSLVVADGLVFAASKDGGLYALDERTGERRWQFSTGNGVYSCPAIAAGTAYVGSADYHLYAVHVNSGDQRWEFTTRGEVNSSPVVAGGVVYVGSDDGTLYAVTTRTGKQKWAFAATGRIRSSPVVAWGRVYVGSDDRRVYAVDVASGRRAWTYRTGGVVKSSPAVADRALYVGSYDGKLHAVHCDTGAGLWTFATGGGVGSSPVVSEGVVFVGSDDGHLYAVDAETGRQRWKFRVGNVVYSSPTVLAGTVYVGCKSGTLYAVDAATGEARWTYRTGADIRSSPAATDGAVYVGNDSGTVFAVTR
ncbi:PQQ-binding-like beta-propeller repeat protein [Streptomyces sp. NPDC058001]|uniref:beta-alanine-activating enzyme beta-propeller domain-containing protein n=1 Tax=Streptomyces sp. NPDC058001 TaxID=3346300 RepID=UPI0036E94091